MYHRPVMRIAHLSDLHFGARVSRKKLAALETDLLSEQPDILAVTGDITDRGRTSQFKWAAAFIHSLGIPFVVVPGNREICFSAIWEWLIHPMAMSRFRTFFGPSDRILYKPENSDVVFFGLNSVHPFPAWPGTLSRETRYWLAEKASGFPGCTKILLLHHPVMPVVRSSSFWAHTFSDAGALLNICVESGIRVILQGHKHRSSVMEVTFPESGSRVIVSACGAPLMSTWDPVYHTIDVRSSSIIVRPREFREGSFNEAGAYSFPRE